ncbi:uncharacterized protein LOC112525399 [Cynara cardunculus var. scolymus]|uniref:uncharacterized protein LOC112525399 n=1 Tax=Cynara cardunculus var. scolymus TaxID=59895 RepID=UPI000D62C2DC|nr:uncharacterized protein LOC112525399 [Cynara cardunculus var. scolymus]
MDHHQDLDHGDINLDLDQLDHNNSNDQNILKNDQPVDLDQNILKNEPVDLDLDHGGDDDDGDLDEDDNDSNGKNNLNYELDPLHLMENNPPESFSVCQAKVADWLNHHTTFIERKTSVKFAITKNLDPTQTRSANRAISLNQRPKLSIIGFRKKPIHHNEAKSKHNDRAENVRLFRNRSEPGRDYCLLINDPVSPKVSCVGRVGSVRVQGRKAGVWRSVKAAFSNLVQTSRVTKVVA